jgi:3-oxoacyl-[acyl-carrier-protein] synthase-3
MKLISTGSACPSRVVSNDDIAKLVQTSDAWIRKRTGIISRHLATSETTRSLAQAAALQALESSDVKLEQISVVICASVSNEVRCPTLACYLQQDLGLANNILALDVNAACSGFIYSLICAQSLLKTDGYALVVGSEVLSRLTDFSDRNTCILFGDAAAAAILKQDNAPFYWVSEAFGGDELINIREQIFINGSEVFKFAVAALVRNLQNVVAQAGLKLSEIPHFICHQANQRILASAARHLGLPEQRFFSNIANYGNTSAASVPLALDEARRQKILQAGEPLVMAGFGGGLTAGAVCMC